MHGGGLSEGFGATSDAEVISWQVLLLRLFIEIAD
jgi:hypothetical protein